MIGTLIPQTRELLQHVRKLSQLAGDANTLARARARRARRALKVHPMAETQHIATPSPLYAVLLASMAVPQTTLKLIRCAQKALRAGPLLCDSYGTEAGSME